MDFQLVPEVPHLIIQYFCHDGGYCIKGRFHQGYVKVGGQELMSSQGDLDNALWRQ